MKTYILAYLGTTFFSLLITPIVIWLAHKIKAYDRPDVRTVHAQPTPRIGGLAIYLSAMFLFIAALFLNNTIGDAFRNKQLQLTTLFCSATFIFLIGVVDDFYGLWVLPTLLI
jgi:UDP-GlcNAc:undecaprenyl-phosphate GlcNAc-1-phosphate transferase